MPINKKAIQDLVDSFKTEKAINRSEDHIQSMFTIPLLKEIGYSSATMVINQGQDVQTGKKPDILLKNDTGNTIFVIESKEAKSADTLDGRYQSKTFVEQLYGYCRGEGIHWGILTNFVEWRVYSVYQGRLYKSKKFAFHELLWANANKSKYVDLLSPEGTEFLNHLSKPNLVSLRGRWDSDPVYYPQQEAIKEKFFQDLKKWRAALRTYLAKKYSSKYSIDELDLITQRILDRLIFIDYCADNGIIPQDRLHASLHTRGDLHSELKSIFSDMDEKFNSELFAHNECDKIDLTDEIVRPIIEELANIDFNQLSVHVIGEVYENYLGELLKSTKSGITVQDTKAGAKKKSQGIYYTPEFIVDYIVENTVGIVLKKCKTISEIEQIKVLDPACGSGSFLIRVFEEFLKHYERIQDTGMFKFEVRKKILQRNIYGVDLDERAVEITKLNLMVKALEGSAHATLIGRKLLPNLKLNIRCGNSLISGEDMEKDTGLFWANHSKDISELKKLRQAFHNLSDDDKQSAAFERIQVLEFGINDKLNQNLTQFFKNPSQIRPFNYSVAFPEIFTEGGFDCVVGNPPYVRPHKIPADVKSALWANLKTFVAKSDLYSCFMEKGLLLTKKKGLFSFITPHTWTSLESFTKIREFFFNNAKILKMVQLPKKVFSTATVETCIFVLQRGVAEPEHQIQVENFDVNKQLTKVRQHPQKEIATAHLHNFQLYGRDSSKPLLKKIAKNTQPLSDLVSFQYGFKTGDDDQFIHNHAKYKESKPFVRSAAVHRYYTEEPTEFVWYVPDSMTANKSTARPGEAARFEKEKIIVSRMGKELIATYDPGGLYVKDAMLLLSQNTFPSLKFIVGLLNSKLMTYYYQEYFNTIDVLKNALLSLPIVKMDASSRTDLKVHKEISDMVDQLLELNATTGGRTKNKIQTQSIQRNIDKAVFQLYNLTQKEISVVEDFAGS